MGSRAPTALSSCSAKKHLRKISGREARFNRYTNHVVSKDVVGVAKGTKRAHVLENLKGIRLRTNVRHKQRERMGKWAFYQLRAFVEYKAKLNGVPVLVVNTRNTSRRCSVCGCTDKRNRVSQSEFKCRSCEHIRLRVGNCNYAINSSVKHTYNVDQISSCIIIFNVQIKCHVALLL